MKGIGTLIIHERYGKSIVTHSWNKTVDPANKKITVLYALTFKIINNVGLALFNEDRRTLFINDPLPRCFENKLHKMKLYEEVTN